MIGRLISLCLARRGLIVALFCAVAIFGWNSWTQLAIEAYPDIGDTSAQVITQWQGHAAEEVEQQVTIPIERALNGIPGLHVIRSRSTFGLSLITLVFRDGVEDYWARQRIRERIEGVKLPESAEPGLDPLSSPIGEIYRYTLESRTQSQRELKELQTWVVAPALRQINGVADVSSFGGETLQFQVILDPSHLVRFNLTLQQIIEAIQANNANSGGSLLVRGEQGFVIRGIGQIRTLDDLGNVVVAEKEGTPVLVRHLGTPQMGGMERRGILGKNDNPDGVSALVLLLRGCNPSKVLDDIHRKADELNHGVLPGDVQIVPYLDRTDLVQATLATVSHTLLFGMGLVVLVLLLFLGSVRSALIVALTVPLSLLFAFVLMRFTNVPANLLSLGAIDFGIIVNGTIVVFENLLQWRERHPAALLDESAARSATLEVARPMLFAMAIIIIAYLPLFSFQRVEGKLFQPIAFTVAYALLGGTLVALTLTPVLGLLYFSKPRRVFRNPVMEWCDRAYQRHLTVILNRPWTVLAPGAGAIVLAIILSVTVGREFLPELDEGSLWLQVTLPPGISLAKGARMADELRKAVKEFPEVRDVVTQLGRVDDGMDPWTPSHIEVPISLYPYRSWKSGLTKAELVERMRRRLAHLPGFAIGFSQPMIDMVNDKVAGAHSELVVKVYGTDLREMRTVAERLVELLHAVPGAADVAVDQEPPLPQLQINIDRAAAARFGINVARISELVETAVGGKAIHRVLIGERSYDIAVRLMEPVRNNPEAIAALLVSTASGARVPLSAVTKIELSDGESVITRESNRRHMTVKINLRGRDLSSFLGEAQKKVANDARLVAYRKAIVWGGQFENQNRAQVRLAVIIPISLGLIFILLYGAFASTRHAALILSSVPLALLGGMTALHIRGMTLNVSSAVGFIALFGVAVQNGVIMVANINRLRVTAVSLREAVIGGAGDRLRSIFMAALVAALGLVPAAMATGIGSDVQRPLATVVVGGICISTLLTLYLLPALYYEYERRILRRRTSREETQGILPPAQPSQASS
jgi:cobalt-zinc-cadmium resistance protein CzcA